MVKMLLRLHWITIELESKIDTVLFPLFTAPFVCLVVEDTWSFDYDDGVAWKGYAKVVQRLSRIWCSKQNQKQKKPQCMHC